MLSSCSLKMTCLLPMIVFACCSPSKTTVQSTKHPEASLFRELSKCFAPVAGDTVLFTPEGCVFSAVDDTRILDVPCVSTDYGYGQVVVPLALTSALIAINAHVSVQQKSRQAVNVEDVWRAMQVRSWHTLATSHTGPYRTVYLRYSPVPPYQPSLGTIGQGEYFFEVLDNGTLVSAFGLGVGSVCPLDPDSLRADVAAGYWTAPDFKPKYRPEDERIEGPIPRR